MTPANAAKRRWEFVIIGTGMGGATLGWALAKAGRSVLFLERGLNLLADARRAGNYAEMFAHPHDAREDLLIQAGRWNEPLLDVTGRKPREFIPFIGMGSGGSTALYGAALERFFPQDFEPGKWHDAPACTLPQRWPVTYEELRPYYSAAEALYQVRGEADPLRHEALDPLPVPPASLLAGDRHIAAHLQDKGLHPYHLPLACSKGRDCQECQGYLCPSFSKRDAASTCLAPAVGQYDAVLLDRSRVRRLEAGADSVHEVLCDMPDGEIRIQGECFVLAAGALNTPALLLNSASSQWPGGLANGSGQVGRNLMRHAIDLYLVDVPSHPGGFRKCLAINDFYLHSGDGKLGTLQSFGTLPPLSMLLDSLHQDLSFAAPWLAPVFPALRPIFQRLLQRMTGGKAVFAGILEDLPYTANRVEPLDERRLRFRYRLGHEDRRRLRRFRRLVRQAFAPWPVRMIAQADNNERIAHVCGTCRFGDDPATSVLDRHNRAHQLDNLYVADASFFPSSAGINPALTIAANALRIADHLLNR